MMLLTLKKYAMVGINHHSLGQIQAMESLFIDHLLCARHWAKGFGGFTSFIVANNLLKEVLL